MRALLLVLMLTLASTEHTKQPEWVSVHPKLQSYYDLFMEHAEAEDKLGGFVLIKFSRLLPNNILGIAYGMNVNVTFVEINANKWLSLTENQRIYVMLHELAHDVLGWKHNNGKDLMVTSLPVVVTTEMIEKALKDIQNGK